MKSILISIKPEWVAKILNGKKTIEIRKTMPKCDLPIDVYIYCTKGKQGIFKERHNGYTLLNQNKWIQSEMNGYVVAKFTLNKVWVMSDCATGCWDYSKSKEENHKTWSHYYELGFVSHKYLHKYNHILDDDANTYSREYGSMLRNESCLSQKEIYNYLNNNKLCMYGKNGYAWHIDNLVIFDRPKELCEFYGIKQYFIGCENGIDKTPRYARLTKAPQSFMFIETEDK